MVTIPPPHNLMGAVTVGPGSEHEVLPVPLQVVDGEPSRGSRNPWD